jgi:hypothetical protein
MALKRLLVVIGAVAVLARGVLSTAYPQASDGKGVPEMIEIDGSKNPELIPEWSAWGFAFRVIATGSRQLPSSVHNVVTRKDAALVLKEAERIQKVDRHCQDRILKLHSLLDKEKGAALDVKLREVTVECRWATLHARDRVLEQLTPEAGAALTAFVVSTKTATSLSIRKKDLARFLEPQ